MYDRVSRRSCFKKGWIDDELLNKIIQKNQNMYSEYLMKIINNKIINYECKVTKNPRNFINNPRNSQ